MLDPALLDEDEELWEVGIELEELEIIDEEDSGWGVEDGGFGVEEGTGREDGRGVVGGELGEMSEGVGSPCGSPVTLGTAGELPELSWRLWSQCRFS